MSLRITTATLHRTALSGLQENLSQLQRLQDQLSSGRQISRPSDSPVGTSTALALRGELRATQQHVRNAEDGLHWLGLADDTLTGMLGDVGRARQLVLAGRNATASPTDRAAMAAEVDAIRSAMLDAANASTLGRPIFAGTADVAAAYERSTGAYLGNTADDVDPGPVGKVERQVAAGVTLRVNLTGPEVFGSQEGGARDLFGVLADIAAHLRSGDTAALDADLGALDARVDGMQQQLATVGARYHQVDSMRDRAERQLLSLTQGLSSVEDIDLHKTIVDLQLQEVAYKSALSATARVIQPSLLDFLR